MKYCPHCNHSAQERDVYCGSCGKVLKGESENRQTSLNLGDFVFGPLWRWTTNRYGESSQQLRTFTIINMIIGLCVLAMNGISFLYFFGTDPSVITDWYVLGTAVIGNGLASILFLLSLLTFMYGSGALGRFMKCIVYGVIAFLVMAGIVYVLPSGTASNLVFLLWVVVSVVVNRHFFLTLWRHKEYVLLYVIVGVARELSMVIMVCAFLGWLIFAWTSNTMMEYGTLFLCLLGFFGVVVVPPLCAYAFYRRDMRRKNITFSQSLFNSAYFLALLAYSFIVPVEPILDKRGKGIGACDGDAFFPRPY